MNNIANPWKKVFSDLEAKPTEIMKRIAKHVNQRKNLIQTVEKHLGSDLTGKKIVEIGAGTAIECLLFTMSGAQCLALDREPQAVTFAGKVHSLFATKSHLCLGDGFKIPVKTGSVDLVMSQGFLEHFGKDGLVTLLHEQVRILKPGGYLLADVPHLKSFYEAYKRIYQFFGPWVFGEEMGISKEMIVNPTRSLGMTIVDSYGWNFRGYSYRNVLDLVYMAPLLLIRNVFRGKVGPDSIGILLRKQA